MKRRSYVKPTLVLIIGLAVAFVLLLISGFLSLNEVTNGLYLETQGNFIEAKSGDTLVLYFYEDAEFDYDYSKKSDSEVRIKTMASGDEYAQYILEMTPTPSSATISYDIEEVYNSSRLIITVEDDVTIKFDLFESYKLEEFETVDLSPTMFVINTSENYLSSTINMISVILGLVVALTGIIWYLIIFNHNNKLVPKQPNYIRAQQSTFVSPQQAPQYSYTSEIERLIETDKQFSLDCQTGKEEAWMNYMHPNVIMGTSSDLPFITNAEEIKNVIGQIFQMENMSFRWKPVYAFVSNDGSLGVTVGLYKRNYMKDGEEVLDKGKYMTVWRKVNGQWKAVFDMGN